MTQRKQSLHLDNLQEVLNASKSSLRKGTQQFETPFSVAEALSTLLTKRRSMIFDPQCGHGNLIHGCVNESTRIVLGSDIDPTSMLPRKIEKRHCIADFTLLFEILAEIQFQCDLIVANPPFSLNWDMDRFTSIPSVLQSLPAQSFGSISRKKPKIDSTLATYLACLHMLTPCGEGMMICNHATAKRLIAPHLSSSHIWYWLVLPNFFPGTVQEMEIAVLYFAKDHRPQPGSAIEPIALASAHPEAIRQHLSPLTSRKLCRGHRMEVQGYSDLRFQRQADRFEAASQEFTRRHNAEKSAHKGWNLYLREGKIVAYLTPFQSLSGTISAEKVDALQQCHGKTPFEMAVMRDTRETLLSTVHSDIWTVHPELIAAVDHAVEAYHRSRCPFIRLSPVQRLGFLDEHDSIECQSGLIDGFVSGKKYELKSLTINNKKTEYRPRPTDEDPDAEEEILVSGDELLFLIRDEEEYLHAFSQHELDQKEHPYCFYHTLEELIDTFVVPDVPDVADRDPELYNEFRGRLLALQT